VPAKHTLDARRGRRAPGRRAFDFFRHVVLALVEQFDVVLDVVELRRLLVPVPGPAPPPLHPRLLRVARGVRVAQEVLLQVRDEHLDHAPLRGRHVLALPQHVVGDLGGVRALVERL